jgi:hypothetical protein
MDKEELFKSWGKTQSHLDAAFDLLSGRYPASDERIAQFREWLDHNELEMALDELAGIGEAYAASQSFWVELRKAAINMELTDRVDHYDLLIERLK